jgi:flavin reductase (DIM6/NTAB) family NADH-FMN oxidoreductase RutF
MRLGSHPTRVNLAVYSFFNAVGASPEMLAFPSDGASDSSTFAGELREFVWRLITWDQREQMNETRWSAMQGIDHSSRAT